MERDVMDIVKEKEFIELSAAERAELGELCSSEEEFNQVKAMFAGIGAMDWSNPTPKAETKESLDHLFAQKHPKAAPIWYNAPLAVLTPKGKPFYRQPLVQAAAVGLLILLAYPFVKSNVMTSDDTQVAMVEKEITPSDSKKENTQGSGEKDKLELEEAEMEGQDFVTPKPIQESLSSDDAVSAPAPMQPSSVLASRSIDKVSAVVAKESNLKDSEVIRGSRGDAASQPGSTHPDGIFIGDKTEVFSVPASREPAVFDLLTSTF